jgi:hypothetical protein
MKTIQKTLLSFAILSIAFISCSKDEEPTPTPTPTPVVYQEENFLSSFLTQSKYNESTTEFTGADRESGIEFTPLVNGKIKALKIRMPRVISDTPTRLTLWDAITQVPLKTFYIQAQTAGVEAILEISPVVQLEKNKKYCFSIQHRSIYTRTATDNVPATFPIKCNNIQIDRLTFKLTTNQNYPNEIISDRYWGDYSFTFQQTE